VLQAVGHIVNQDDTPRPAVLGTVCCQDAHCGKEESVFVGKGGTMGGAG
jgi:hypothetical protein